MGLLPPRLAPLETISAAERKVALRLRTASKTGMKRTHSMIAMAFVFGAITISSSARAHWQNTPAKNSSSAKVQLTPHYSPGQVVRYQLESTTITNTRETGTISDPQGASALTVTWNATVRMEVLSAGKDASGKPDGSLRMRTTYEKSAATHSTDAYDPEAEGIENQYHNLEGKSFEFLIDPTGRVTSVAGFEESSQSGTSASALRVWMGQLAATSGAPRDGISIGQSWQSEQPVPASPLDGLAWRSRSTYLRNEPCKAVKSADVSGTPTTNDSAGEASGEEMCAVIMTKVALVRLHGAGRDAAHEATPPSYRKNNLRTFGEWTGDGESLSYVSLGTGRLVSVAQSSSEQMNFTVVSLQVGSNVHYDGAVKTRTQLSLLPAVSGHP